MRHEKLESKGNVVIEITETAQMGCRYATPHFSNSLPTNSTIGASKSTIRTVITPTSPPVRNPSIVAIRLQQPQKAEAPGPECQCGLQVEDVQAHGIRLSRPSRRNQPSSPPQPYFRSFRYRSAANQVR